MKNYENTATHYTYRKNAQLHLTLPAEYANQDVELVVIIQPRKETMERQNWLAFLNQSYGCLADDPLARPE